MCGIFAVIRGPEEKQHELRALCDFMRQACVVGTLRGGDSTGMFQVDKNGEVEITKMPISGELFAEAKRAQRLMSMADTNIITVGHHRAATVGTVSYDNCHPFEHYASKGDKYLVGVHNGYMEGHRWKEDDINFTVDSDWGLYQIYKHGPEKGVGKLKGAMALVWYQDDGKIRVFGNGKRPIYWAFIKDHNAMLLASEHGMLWWLASRNNISIEKGIFYPAEDTIYAFDPKNLRAFEISKIEKPPVVVSPPPINRFPGLGGPVSDLPFNQGSHVGDWEAARRRAMITAGRVSAKKPAVDKDKTWQQHPVKSSPEEVKKCFRIDYGSVVVFSPDNATFGITQDIEAIIGEVLIEDKGMVDSALAIMDGATQTVKLNVIRVDRAKGTVKCRVIGCTRVSIHGKEHPCLLVSRPIELEGDDLEDVNITEEGADSDFVKGPNGVLISKEEFKRLTKDGCAWCKDPLTEADVEKITWYPNSSGPSDPLCTECAKHVADETNSSNTAVIVLPHDDAE